MRSSMKYAGTFFVAALICLGAEKAYSCESAAYNNCARHCNISNKWANNNTYNACRANCFQNFCV